MKIYSKLITGRDVLAAVHAARAEDGADIHVDSIGSFLPRSGGNGTELYCCSDSGTRATGRNQSGYDRGSEPRAASWDAYGHVIARLFVIDPDAKIGNYNGVTDFIDQVGRANRKEPTDFLDKVTGALPFTVMDEQHAAAQPGNPYPVRAFATKAEARRFIDCLPGASAGRYGIAWDEEAGK